MGVAFQSVTTFVLTVITSRKAMPQNYLHRYFTMPENRTYH